MLSPELRASVQPPPPSLLLSVAALLLEDELELVLLELLLDEELALVLLELLLDDELELELLELLTPVPVRLIVLGVLLTVVEMLTLPLAAPAAVGLKVRLSVHDEAAASDDEQPLLTTKAVFDDVMLPQSRCWSVSPCAPRWSGRA